MTTYRHLNLLIDSVLYEGLRTRSRKAEISISKIVRDALTTFLDPKNEELKGKALDGQNKNTK